LVQKLGKKSETVVGVFEIGCFESRGISVNSE
jgi:hypothetical protein